MRVRGVCYSLDCALFFGEWRCSNAELTVDLLYSASDVDYEEAERFGGYHLVHVGALAHG